MSAFGAKKIWVWVVLLLCACSTRTSPVPQKKPKGNESPVNDFKLPDDKESQPLAAEDIPIRTLVLEEPIRYEDCHLLFEPGGQPHNKLPYKETLNSVLAGCDPEAYRFVGEELIVGYGTPRSDNEARDLAVNRYSKDGELLWHNTLDRSRNAKNFIANFRGSFVSPLDDMICAGTLWEGGTQTFCSEAETGKKIWDGRIPAWSGISPVGVDGGLFVADLTAITKRYPFTGAEMQYKRLSGMGGRAGFYAANEESLFFVPSRSDDAVLHRYDFSTLKEQWATKLPTHPMSVFSYVAGDVLLIKIDETMYAVDQDSGLVLWGYTVGDDRPSLAHKGNVLYVLHRRPADPNLLVAIDLASGKRLYRAETPSGILHVKVVRDDVFVRGVRAVQRVNNP